MLLKLFQLKKSLDSSVVENIDKKYYGSDHYDASLNKYGVKCGTSLRFWKSKGSINGIDPYGWFQWYFRYWYFRWKGVVSRFKGILVKLIKDKGGKFAGCNISPKIRQILLH